MIITKVKTIFSLGIVNLGRVFIYRASVKLGLNSVKKISANIDKGVFFREVTTETNLPVNTQWLNQQCFFGWIYKTKTEPPCWYQSVLTHKFVKKPMQPWWSISDFDNELGDIKGVWEASRFDWAISFAQDAAVGNKESLIKLNDWLNDWCKNNPPYLGINWKCGQEASIRVMHLAMTAIILKQHLTPTLTLISFIRAHLQRILPTISYAMAQDNNHGTSEAAALFIGGSWLTCSGDSTGDKYYKKGRKWLENRAKRLIERDGSFSQYSTTYHRVMLDTFSMAEVWRKQLNLKPFSQHLYTKLSAASSWLYQMTQFENGDAPNLGANDGARLLPLTATDYRDFRPSVQLAAALFLKKRAYKEKGEYNLPLLWLGLTLPKELLSKQNDFNFEQGGYLGLRARKNKVFAMLSYPKFHFRPSQCDALHIDFWLDGKNLLRDGGTFSYNAGEHYIRYYGGTESHNTVMFDRKDQMPRLSRFLLGNWLKTSNIFYDKDNKNCQVSYKNIYGHKHQRKLSLTDKALVVEDTVSGFNNGVILRWRLSSGAWQLHEKVLTDGKHTIKVNANVPIVRIALIKGRESRYYYQETTIPVLEIEVEQAGSIITEYQY